MWLIYKHHHNNVITLTDKCILAGDIITLFILFGIFVYILYPYMMEDEPLDDIKVILSLLFLLVSFIYLMYMAFAYGSYIKYGIHQESDDE